MKDRKFLWVLALCAVILTAVIWQSAELTRLRAEMEDRQLTFEKRTDDLQKSLETPETICSVTTSSVDVKKQAITLNVTVTIPNCVSDDLGADIYGVRGNTVLNQFYLYLGRGEDGSYTGSVTLPLDPEVGLELKRDQKLLYRCDSMAELLPVQMTQASGSTSYDQELGLIYQAEWDVELTDPQGEAAEVTNTEYRIYQNDKLVFSGPCYIPEPREGEKMMEGWGLPCKAGDIVDLRYACTDKFGLSYEFPLRSWRITASKAQERWPSSFVPVLTWPE